MDLRDALQILDSRKWFSLRVLTANVTKGTGGKVLEIPKARIAHKQTAQKITNVTGITKETNQGANFTRQIELAESGRVITIHPILITHINNTALV